ncbi:unnamed protein product [Linum trigynum]|uniref:Uncharacterized protein n=1 Tax=Linum trigynum TaxID=586398 RepID=A0AAV2D2G2_9ROSI
MDGLIPLVCRAFKRNKTRQHYECLSSGAAAQPYNAADFLISAADHVPSLYTNIPPPRSEFQGDRGDGGHRRYMSTAGDFAPERHGSPAVVRRSSSVVVAGGGKQQEMVRFRSHRRMFSCVSLGED